ncbi:hypothetical protein BJY04DRAFT_179163 [Aspergillus karnatakaensis]|uniref:uncharacterized protein n=1 Tax=Aspergillus karnatakaensis TaxID=1810916 RepID=UPI003CCD3CF9
MLSLWRQARTWFLGLTQRIQTHYSSLQRVTYGLYLPELTSTADLKRRLSMLTIAGALAIFVIMLMLSMHFTSVHGVSPDLDWDTTRTFCQHPIERLFDEASSSFDITVHRQSSTLAEAVTEYKRRYNMPPPPHFDKWYQFAVDRKTVLVDEFDSIYHSLLPFWAVQPGVLRQRTRENLGYADNKLMGVSIRDGKVSVLGTGQGEFQSAATEAMISSFSEWLPDMDLAFNVHDEPRVVIPHDELEMMVAAGREAHARLNSVDHLNGSYSSSPAELDVPIENVLQTRFYNLAQQLTYQASRLSCPVDSPARDPNGEVPDNSTAYATTLLGFVYNQTAFSDVCLRPSLKHHVGLFNRPNAFKVTYELSPVFSASKLSSFQDILYPSPWYYAEKSVYDSNFAVDWENKTDQLYWRGYTSGGHSESGEWHNLLRQRVMANLIAPGEVFTLEKESSDDICGKNKPAWDLKKDEPELYKDYFNAGFTGIGYCSEADCKVQEEFFGTVPFENQTEAWKYRYLLDMDGHAFSGRFYSFLRSKSLPLKIAHFREWHSDILFPWVHYAPLSVRGGEYTEVMRFFKSEGGDIARYIAHAGTEWAERVLTKGNFEVWMFRLLLEFGRVVDDNRESLGYAGDMV